jgi:single-strand DNA-binding protein
MNQYLSKGRPVFVEGRLKLDQWEDRESGKTRSKLRVVIEAFQFIDSPGNTSGGGRGGSRTQPAGAPSGPGPSGGGSHEPINEDDIPF